MNDFMAVDFNVRYSVEKCGVGFRFRFYCDLSGMTVYETEPIQAADENSALYMAKEIVRSYFNRCSKCGRWISDLMYNIDEMQCVECAPYKIEPQYCTECSSPIPKYNQYCTRCGHKAVCNK